MFDFNDVKNRYDRFMNRFFVSGHNNDREYRKSFALAAKDYQPDIMPILMNGFGKPDLDLDAEIKDFLEKRV